MPKNHSINKCLCALLLLLMSCLCAAAQANEIKYTLNLNDRMLDVEIEVPANNLDKTSFGLSDWGGQSNYAENIYRVAARNESGAALALEKTDARTWTIANFRKPFKLTYAVVSQKDSFMGDDRRNHFHPTVFKNYVFLWGTTFLFYPDGEALASMPVKLRINPNEYVNYYTNFSEKANSFADLKELFVAAGDYRVLQKNIGGRNVKFLVQGKNWKFSDEQFAETVSKIIDAQTKYIGFSPSGDNLLITLNEGTPASRGGTVVKNVISVYPNPQSGLQDFDTLKLISHEHFHFWNGNCWRDAEDKKEGYYKWMSEGFTEYYAGLTLVRENLITEKEFVAWLNKLLVEYQTNPQAQTATAEILSEKYWESQAFNRLPYVKGALIALLTDLQIRQKTGGKKQIDDLMKLLIKTTDRKEGYDDKILLTGFDAVSQTDNRQFYKDYMLGARVLPVVEVLKNSEIVAAEKPHEVFDLGFTTENGKLERGAKIKEITSPSATEAGIKAGDELRGFSFNYGKTQEQASVTVQRSGETLPVKYFPKKTINVVQIDENARITK